MPARRRPGHRVTHSSPSPRNDPRCSQSDPACPNRPSHTGGNRREAGMDWESGETAHTGLRSGTARPDAHALFRGEVALPRQHRRHQHVTMSKVALTTELPIPAGTAAALARKPELMKYLLRPVLRAYRLEVPRADRSRHTRVRAIVVVWRGSRVDPPHHHQATRAHRDLHVRARADPLKTWNHRLTFEPLDDHHCRYTDEIETDDGLRGALRAARHRHRGDRAVRGGQVDPDPAARRHHRPPPSAWSASRAATCTPTTRRCAPGSGWSPRTTWCTAS